MSEFIKTAIGDAFARAGYETAADKLRRMMSEAIKRGGGRFDPSKDYFVDALRGADDRADLLWQLFEPARSAMISNLFRDVLSEVRERRGFDGKESDQGANAAVPQGRIQSSPSVAPHMTRGGQADDAGDGQGSLSPAVMPHTPAGPRPVATTPSYRAAGEVAKLALLRTFRINGKAIGDCTGAEARGWLTNHERDSRFVRLLVEPVRDHEVIGTARTATEAEECWRLATEAVNA